MTMHERAAGKCAYRTGLAAEEGVLRHYLRAGLAVIARRWRGRGGEIDLIARDGEGYIFIEVKAAKTLAQAAERLTRRQARRLAAAAEEFLCRVAGGPDATMRFDVALVDALGRIDIRRNIMLLD